MTIIPNMPGKSRPYLITDKLGQPESVGDKDWAHKLKKFYTQVAEGWVRKNGR